MAPRCSTAAVDGVGVDRITGEVGGAVDQVGSEHGVEHGVAWVEHTCIMCTSVQSEHEVLKMNCGRED